MLDGHLYLRQLPESATITRPATSCRTVLGFDVKVQVPYWLLVEAPLCWYQPLCWYIFELAFGILFFFLNARF